MTPYGFKVPKIKTLEAQYIDGTSYPCVNMDYDTIYYDQDTMTYKSKEQYLENKMLKKELIKSNLKLEEKKKYKDSSIKSLIAYFYKNRT